MDEDAVEIRGLALVAGSGSNLTMKLNLSLLLCRGPNFRLLIVELFHLVLSVSVIVKRL
jgi:hypothetical protein